MEKQQVPELTSIRLGEIRDEVSARLGRLGVTEVMKRDLKRYYEGVADTLARLHLTEPEASLICDALNGTWLQESVAARHLWAEVEDAIQLNRLDRKWSVEGPSLVERLRGLTLAQAWAVVDAVERFWATSDLPTREALRAAGLIREAARREESADDPASEA